MNRRKFISISYAAGMAIGTRNIIPGPASIPVRDEAFIMTVTGKINTANTGIFLPHEHIVTDFAGAETGIQPRYDRLSAFKTFLPYLEAVKESGVDVFVDCTPAYIGRDVILLKQLSEATGLHIVSNTGYYAAAGLKFLPRHAYSESSQQLAGRWIKEWDEGIEGTGIRPGFIKLGVDGGPLKPVQQKLIEAAAQTHLSSGMKIAIHNGNATAVEEELRILLKNGVDARAFIWVHSQNDADGKTRIELAKKGCWISLDGINQTDASVKTYCGSIQALKREGLLDRILLSHDDGFAVENNGVKATFNPYQNGNVQPYRSLFSQLKPALLNGILTADEFANITTANPAKAFRIEVCRG